MEWDGLEARRNRPTNKSRALLTRDEICALESKNASKSQSRLRSRAKIERTHRIASIPTKDASKRFIHTAAKIKSKLFIARVERLSSKIKAKRSINRRYLQKKKQKNKNTSETEARIIKRRRLNKNVNKSVNALKNHNSLNTSDQKNHGIESGSSKQDTAKVTKFRSICFIQNHLSSMRNGCQWRKR